MSYVLTLIAKPLTNDHIHQVKSLLPGNSHIDWLAEGTACDLFFDAAQRGIEDQVRGALGDMPVDLFCQPNGGTRRKKLLVADMDSTIITAECIDEMADLLGLKNRVAMITERAMAGELDFPAALRERAAMLKGLSVNDLERVFDQRIHLTPGARQLVATMRANGAYTALISGGFSFFTQRVAAAAGFDHHQANILQFSDCQLTGEIAEPILGSSEKLAALQALSAHWNLETRNILAVGDGANDLEMIGAAGLGVAFHAQPIVAQAAPARIDHNDLTALLYLQGYRDSQIRE